MGDYKFILSAPGIIVIFDREAIWPVFYLKGSVQQCVKCQIDVLSKKQALNGIYIGCLEVYEDEKVFKQ